MKVYELAEELKKVESEIDAYADEHYGEIPPDLLFKLDKLQAEQSKIIEGIYKSFKNRIALDAALESEIKTLQSRIKSNNRTIESLKDLLGKIIGTGNKYANGLVNISWKKSERLIIDETWEYPETFYKIKTSKVLSKEDMKAYIKEGGIIEHAEIVECQNIQIK